MTVSKFAVCNHIPGIYCPNCNPQPRDFPPFPSWPATDTKVVGFREGPKEVERLQARITELETELATVRAQRGVLLAGLRAVAHSLAETLWNAKAARNTAASFLDRLDDAS